MFNPFAVLKILPKLFKRMASGEILAADETTANFGYSRVRLTAKREIGSGEPYAVLSVISSDNHQHFHLSPSELDALANIARVMQSKVRESKTSDASGLSAAPSDLTRRMFLGGAKAVSAGQADKVREGRRGIVSKTAILIVALLVILLFAKLLQQPEALLKALG
jgi:hypothetical protein